MTFKIQKMGKTNEVKTVTAEKSKNGDRHKFYSVPLPVVELIKTIGAHIRADTNLMDNARFEKLCQNNIKLSTKRLSKLVSYKMDAATKKEAPDQIQCEKVSLDMEQHIRHESSLMLRNLSWFDTDHSVSEP